jgi:TolA-binding protein
MLKRWIGRISLRYALGAAMMFATANTVLAQDDTDTLRPYYSGNGFLNRELYDLAAQEYTTFLEEAPYHEKAAVARYGLAVCLVRLGRHADAVSHLEKLVGLNDFEYSAETQMMLGQSRLALGDYARAAEAFGTVLDRHGNSELADEAAALRAEAFYYNRDHGLVEGPAQLLIDRFPDSPLRERTEFFRALASMASGNYSRSADQFDAMLVRFPEGQYAGQATLLMGQSLHRSNVLPRALQNYERVVEGAEAAYVPDALYGMAIILHRDGKMDRAAKAVDRLLAEFPENGNVANAQLLRGRISFDRGQYDAAKEDFAALEAGPEDLRDDAAYWLGKCSLRLNEPMDTIKRLEAALKDYPASSMRAEMLYDLAVALHRTDQYEQSVETLQRFDGAFPDHQLSAPALHLMASARHQQGQYAASTPLCDRFLATYAEHELAAEIRFIAAENAFLQKNYQDAEGGYAAYLAQHPQSPRVLDAEYRRGMSLYHLNRLDDAAGMLVALEAAAHDDERYRLALFAQGDIAFQQNDWALAQEYFKQYLSHGEEQIAADDARLKLGLADMRQGRAAEALVSFDRFLEQYPTSPHRAQAMFERGQALVMLERFDDAEVVFTAFMQEFSGTSFAPHALNHLGTIAQRAERHDDAAKYFAQVSEVAPTLDIVPETMFQRGQSLLAARRLADAEAVLTELLNEYPEAARAASAAALRAIAVARQGRQDDALALISVVEQEYMSKLDASLRGSLLYEKAWCQRGREDLLGAESTYQQLIKIEDAGPLRLHAMLERAEIQAADERFGTAQEQLEALLQLLKSEEKVPADLARQASYRIGVCEFRLGAFERSADRFDRYLQEYPQSDVELSARLLGGESHFNLGQHTRAIEHLKVITEGADDTESYGPALLRLGECYAVLQYWPQSGEAYEQYMVKFPDSAQWFQAQFGIGWSLDNRGEHAQAIDAYRPVVDRHRGPTAARAQFQIGECLFAMGRHSEAVRELLKVDILYGYPEWSAAALYEAGRCFQAMNDPVQARRQFEQVREKHADTEWATLASQRLEEMASTTLPGRR